MMSGLPLAIVAALVLAGCSRRHEPPPVPAPTPVASPTPAVSPSVAPSPTPSPVATPSPTPTAGYVVPPATRVVSPTGSPTSDCRPATPCRTLARAAEVAVAGDVVVIEPGTYAGAVTVRGDGTPTSPILFVAKAKGSVIVKGLLRPASWQGEHHNQAKNTANSDVIWRGLVVHGGANFWSAWAAEGWRFEQMLFEDSQGGINIRGHRVVVEQSVFEDLKHHALVGVGGHGIIIRGNTIRRINAKGTEKVGNSAVTKFLRTDGLLVEGNDSAHNVGPGFWLDAFNTNYVVRNNHFHDNRGNTAWWQGPGFWTEINPGPGLIEGNVISGNTGPGIGINESENVEVRNNLLVGNARCIEFRNMFRWATAPRIRNIRVHSNRCTRWTSVAVATSIGERWKGWTPKANNVVIDGNLYDPLPGKPFFAWLGTTYSTLEAVRASLGFEATGRVQ